MVTSGAGGGGEKEDTTSGDTSKVTAAAGLVWDNSDMEAEGGAGNSYVVQRCNVFRPGVALWKVEHLLSSVLFRWRQMSACRPSGKLLSIYTKSKTVNQSINQIRLLKGNQPR